MIYACDLTHCLSVTIRRRWAHFFDWMCVIQVLLGLDACFVVDFDTVNEVSMSGTTRRVER